MDKKNMQILELGLDYIKHRGSMTRIDVLDKNLKEEISRVMNLISLEEKKRSVVMGDLHCRIVNLEKQVEEIRDDIKDNLDLFALLTEHVEFRNGTLILKYSKLEE